MNLFTKTALTMALVGLMCSTVLISSARGDEGHRPFKHVFVIVLENEGFDTTFGANSPAPYLAQTLTSEGVLLNQYCGTGHASLDNYIAMISGQAATPQTRNDCVASYADFVLTGITPDGQAIGSGCVYPAQMKTIADQLTAKGIKWRAYMEDMGNDPAKESAVCGRPVLNMPDLTNNEVASSASVPLGDQYASRHDPFVYFHSITDTADCSNVVNLNLLVSDLKSERTTPNFVFMTPNVCDDGHDAPCVNGQPGGLVSVNAFLEKWIPMIQASDAHQAGKVSNTPFNHYSLLKTLEDIFDTDSYLGYAGQPGLLSFFGCVPSDIHIGIGNLGDSEACNAR